MRGSGFRVQGCGGGFAANIYGAMPKGSWVAVFPYRHLERSREIFLADREIVYVRKSVAPASARRHFPITACMLISVVQSRSLHFGRDDDTGETAFPFATFCVMG